MSYVFSGGSFRHFLWQVCKELQSSALSLLLPCPSAAANRNKVHLRVWFGFHSFFFLRSFTSYRMFTQLDSCCVCVCCRGSTSWRHAPSLTLKSSCWTSSASCSVLPSGQMCLCLWICSAPSGRVWSVKHSTQNLTFEKPTFSHTTTSRSLTM